MLWCLWPEGRSTSTVWVVFVILGHWPEALSAALSHRVFKHNLVLPGRQNCVVLQRCVSRVCFLQKDFPFFRVLWIVCLRTYQQKRFCSLGPYVCCCVLSAYRQTDIQTDRQTDRQCVFGTKALQLCLGVISRWRGISSEQTLTFVPKKEKQQYISVGTGRMFTEPSAKH